MKFEITKGKQKRAIRLCAYGPEGIGKSTFAAAFPDPLFIDTEGGTHQLDVARFPKPESWNDLLAEIDAVIEEPEVCRTLVIDTVDRAEMLLTAQLLAEGRCDSIEKYGGGYGKGYTALAERFTKDFLMRLDKVIAKGVNVTLIAHAAMRKMESPEDPPYDRWELKVSKKVAPLVKEWVDILLFMNFEAVIVEENGRNKAKGKARRVMHANHRPTYDAKNRYGLPDDMELSYKAISAAYDVNTPVTKEHSTLNIDTPTEALNEADGLEDERDALLRHLEQKRISKAKFEAWLVATGRIARGGSAYDISATMARNMDEHIDVLVSEIKGDK